LSVDLTPLLQQSEDQFAYGVISRVLERSADGNHVVDAILVGLMAAQAAIYAIVLDKVGEYPAVDWALLLGAFILAVVGTVLTVFVREAPDPRSFVADFPDDPEGTRRKYIETYIAKARLNDRVRAVKTVFLGLALAMTVVQLVIATISRTGVV
jgi:hypothetical protein